MYRPIGKRFVDVVLASFALVVLSPVFGAIALAIWLNDSGPALLKQQRVGRSGSEFSFLKFRSMPVDSATVESADADTLRITRVGRIIRRTSLDELPQLVNIVRGDMSIVGPRPSLPTQTDLVELRTQNGALELRPGLTGMAQINSFDGMSAEEKAEWDGYYVKTVSLMTDAAIVVRTIRYLAKPPPTY